MRPHSSTLALAPPARRVASRTRLRREVKLFLAAYLVYTAARWVFAGDLATAREHAGWIVDLEQATGVAVEASVQGALSTTAVSWVLSNVYLAAQLVVLPGALVWLYRRSWPVYRVLRNTVVATWLLSVPIFALFPVAPPRLAGLGLADTVSQHAPVALTGSSTIFYNPYAAVPSLHVGFAFAIGIAVAAAVRSPRAKFLAALWGPLVTLTVVATGNHYVFDIAAGLAVTAAGFGLGRYASRGHRAAGSHRLAVRVRGADPAGRRQLLRRPARSAGAACGASSAR